LECSLDFFASTFPRRGIIPEGIEQRGDSAFDIFFPFGVFRRPERLLDCIDKDIDFLGLAELIPNPCTPNRIEGIVVPILRARFSR
jgi:hypothetical protein